MPRVKTSQKMSPDEFDTKKSSLLASITTLKADLVHFSPRLNNLDQLKSQPDIPASVLENANKYKNRQLNLELAVTGLEKRVKQWVRLTPVMAKGEEKENSKKLETHNKKVRELRTRLEDLVGKVAEMEEEFSVEVKKSGGGLEAGNDEEMIIDDADEEEKLSLALPVKRRLFAMEPKRMTPPPKISSPPETMSPPEYNAPEQTVMKASTRKRPQRKKKAPLLSPIRSTQKQH